MLYDVTFKTGVLPNSGTSANVFFQIHGDEESTEEIQLQEDKSLNLFDTGGTDKFAVETKDVGKVSCAPPPQRDVFLFSTGNPFVFIYRPDAICAL